MKSYTDLEQSKVLAKILPLESADMYYRQGDVNKITIGKGIYKDVKDWFLDGRARVADIPCWSLASLLDVLPKVINNETLFIETSPALWHIGYRDVYIARADNPVDACVAMIEKLHELKML